MLLRLAVPCRIESKVLCTTPHGLRQWIESSSESSVHSYMHIVQINLVKGHYPVRGLFEVRELISSEAITGSGLLEGSSYSRSMS